VFKDFGMYTQSTDADTCKMIIEVKGLDSTIGRFCATLLQYRMEAKEYGTYVDGIRKRILAGTTRVYPSFLLHGTTEGRLSCRNPNLQNVPRKSAIRRLSYPTKSEISSFKPTIHRLNFESYVGSPGILTSLQFSTRE